MPAPAPAAVPEPAPVAPPAPAPAPAAPAAAPAAAAEATPTPTPASPPRIDPEDPNKGQFGGRASTIYGTLSATVTEAKPGWYDVHLRVAIPDSAPSAVDEVLFYLHPTFRVSESLYVPIEHGEAVLDLVAYGAFTVGVELRPVGERLELDLAELTDAPMAFRLS